MRFVCIAAVLAAALAAGAAADSPNSLSADERRQGWILLFDGSTLAGWEPLPTSSPNTGGEWRVENGALVCPGASPGWLAGSRSFDNFVLKLEFRGAATVNSGVFIRSAKEGQPHLTGYEVQIWERQPDGYTTGSLVGSAKAAPAKIIPREWNRYEITANRDHFTVVLNGDLLLDARDSKHLSAGVIGFQCQKDNPIEFRGIKLQPIE
jgi:hypothetical protein